MLKLPQMPPRHAPNNNNNDENNNNNNNNNNNVIQQLVEAHAQLMQMITQFIQANANNNNNNNNHPLPPPPPPPQVDRLARFLRLRPTKFSSATEPIVADDWLRSVRTWLHVSAPMLRRCDSLPICLKGQQLCGGRHTRSLIQ
jgi:hypothetical protein